MDINDAQIAQRFQYLVREKNLTQQEISSDLNFSRSYISAILTGRSEMSGRILRALANAGWDIHWILTGKAKDSTCLKCVELETKLEQTERLIQLITGKAKDESKD
jgi:transcriptional regulator with XRE-family HTH domain